MSPVGPPCELWPILRHQHHKWCQNRCFYTLPNWYSSKKIVSVKFMHAWGWARHVKLKNEKRPPPGKIFVCVVKNFHDTVGRRSLVVKDRRVLPSFCAKIRGFGWRRPWCEPIEKNNRRKKVKTSPPPVKSRSPTNRGRAFLCLTVYLSLAWASWTHTKFCLQRTHKTNFSGNVLPPR